MVGRVPYFAAWVRFWIGGRFICRIFIKDQKGLTKLGKVLGRCNDVHIHMEKGHPVPPPAERFERYRINWKNQ